MITSAACEISQHAHARHLGRKAAPTARGIRDEISGAAIAVLTGLLLGYALLHVWDVIGGLDPFDARYGRW